MIIKESQFTESPLMLLDQLDILGEADFMDAYPASMVPIVHVNRLGQDLIKLESFMDYSQANGISNGGNAITKVCDACGCPIDNIAFMVSEANMYADDDLIDTVAQICEAGFDVHLIAEPDDSIYSVKLREAMVMDEPYDKLEECENLANYCMYPIIQEAGMMEDTKNTIAKKLAAVRKAIAQQVMKVNNATGSAKVFANNQLKKLKSAAEALKGRLVDAYE